MGRPAVSTIAICVLLSASLVLLPQASLARSAGVEEGGGPAEINRDPLGRLPAAPEEAHQRLEGLQAGWPIATAGDATDVGTAGVQPGLMISIPFNTVEGYTTHASANVRVELWRGGVVISTIDATTNTNKWFYIDFDSVSQDIKNGDYVRVVDLADMTEANVDCTLDATFDVANEKVTGNTPTHNEVDVYIKAPSTYYGDIPPGVAHRHSIAAGGAFTADFNGVNTRNGDVAYLYSTNGAGHVVANIARSGPVLVVYPQYDEIMGFYTPGTSLTITAGVATKNVGTGADGFFDAWFSHHNVEPGETVSCDLGTNRSITTADVAASADPASDEVRGTAPPNRLMRITMNTYRGPVMVELWSDANGAYSYDFTGLYDISGIEVFNVAWYNDAGDCVVYEFQTYSWFMPEGYTGQGFDTWVLIMNPNDYSAQVRVVYQTGDGPVAGPLLDLPPDSRVNVHVNDWLPPGTHVSTMATAIDGAFIMAERAMYMYGTPDGKWGAHDSIGILTPSPVWYLPEGATLPGFDEWVLVQNPNNVPVQARVQFLEAGGVAGELPMEVGANSRVTVAVNHYFPDREISTRVESLTEVDGELLPVFVERAMYMNTADGKRGAHDSIGIATPAPEWYLPEGATLPGFDEWVLVMNPNDFPTTVRVSFLTSRGVGATRDVYMHPNSRGTIHANVEIPNEEVSTVVTSLEGAGIMAERAMYMNTADGKRGAHDSIGSCRTSTYWFLPEGTTLPGFDEWVLVQNPDDMAAEVRVTFLGPSGIVNRITFPMNPNSRFSVHVNEYVNNLDVSTVVESIGMNPQGILAERAMYMWTADNKQGAHDSIGIPSF